MFTSGFELVCSPKRFLDALFEIKEKLFYDTWAPPSFSTPGGGTRRRDPTPGREARRPCRGRAAARTVASHEEPRPTRRRGGDRAARSPGIDGRTDLRNEVPVRNFRPTTKTTPPAGGSASRGSEIDGGGSGQEEAGTHGATLDRAWTRISSGGLIGQGQAGIWTMRARAECVGRQHRIFSFLEDRGGGMSNSGKSVKGRCRI